MRDPFLPHILPASGLRLSPQQILVKCEKRLVDAVHIVVFVPDEILDDHVRLIRMRQREARFFQECLRLLSAENVAAVVGLSPSHLRALFREAGEESPIRYLNRVRIEHAKEMIASGMFHLDEIAAACGFSSVYYFSRVFKSYVGVPPGKY